MQGCMGKTRTCMLPQRNEGCLPWTSGGLWLLPMEPRAKLSKATEAEMLRDSASPPWGEILADVAEGPGPALHRRINI
jgi:hypothetical protein